MNYIFFSAILVLFFAIISFRRACINSFKISYYEARLKNNGFDISHVENIGIIGIIKL